MTVSEYGRVVLMDGVGMGRSDGLFLPPYLWILRNGITGAPWVRQLHPVPLHLLTRRVLDHRVVAAPAGLAGLAVRAQPVRAQPAGERRIRPVEPQPPGLVEQRGRPHVRVVPQPLAQVGGERPERVLTAARALPGDPAAGQVGAHGLAVTIKVPGDRRDRPALPAERVGVHIVLPCQHQIRVPSSRWWGSETATLEGTRRHVTTPRSGCPKWGHSVSRTGEIHTSAVSNSRTHSLWLWPKTQPFK